MPSAPILCLGAQWKACDVYWKTAPENGTLYGVNSKNLTGSHVNHAHQTGIYILYGDYKPVYVGQANGSLFARLQMHYRKDDLVGRWDTFTWVGMREPFPVKIRISQTTKAASISLGGSYSTI